MCRIMATDSALAEGWQDGLQSTMSNVHIKRWAMRRHRSGTAQERVMGQNHRGGTPCSCGPETRSKRSQWNLACWGTWVNTASSKTELENRAPSALQIGTHYKRGGEDDQRVGRSLFPILFKRGTKKTGKTITRAASKNTSLKNAPRGTNNGVHLIAGELGFV